MKKRREFLNTFLRKKKNIFKIQLIDYISLKPLNRLKKKSINNRLIVQSIIKQILVGFIKNLRYFLSHLFEIF